MKKMEETNVAAPERRSCDARRSFDEKTVVIHKIILKMPSRITQLSAEKMVYYTT